MKTQSRLFALVALSILLVACASHEQPEEERNRAVAKTNRKAALQFHRKYELEMIGQRLGTSQDPATPLGIVLYEEADPTIDEAKELLHCVVQEYFDLVRSEPELEPHLAHAPIELGNIEVSIFFDHHRLRTHRSPFVTGIDLVEGQVRVYLLDDTGHPQRLVFSYEGCSDQSKSSGDADEYAG